MLLLALPFFLAALPPNVTPVYENALAPGWQSWSWTGDIDFASAAPSVDGTAIHAQLGGWGAVSLHAPGTFGLPTGERSLQLRYQGPGGTVWLVLESDTEHVQTPRTPIGELAPVQPGSFTEVTLDLSALGAHAWTRIDLMDATGAGVEFSVDDIALSAAAPLDDHFTAAEPVGPTRLMLLGGGDPATVAVTLDGAALPVVDFSTVDAVDGHPGRTYLALGVPLSAGALSVCVPERCFDRTIAAAAGPALVADGPTHPISPEIYGIAVPADVGAAVAANGATVVRWGGNATSTWDPVGHFTNHASDWFFENSDGGDAVAWMAQVRAAGALSAFTLPAMDWVAKDDHSCAFSVAKYGVQQNTDPYHPDCGDGHSPDGTNIVGNDPRDHMRPWDVNEALVFMGGVATPPDVVFVGNELDIAAGTHRDVHPDASSYDELRDRFLRNAEAVRTVWPTARVAGPSSCCWWYYWNSAAGANDKAAHGGADFLPWFLDEIAQADAILGLRHLDLLDVHFYPDGAFNDHTDDATRALRLRVSRDLWDPTYRDEGWIGQDQWATQTQPNRNNPALIPRLRRLLNDHLPGTALGITEWNFGAEQDWSGGLAVADVLGVFGREGLDHADYWTTPPAGSPAEAAFQLYRLGDRPFGDTSLPVSGFDPNALGVYAAVDADGRKSLIVLNKSATDDVLLSLPGISGQATAHRFGGALGGALTEDPPLQVDGAVLVPATGAMRIVLDVGEPPPPPIPDAGVDAAVVEPVGDAAVVASPDFGAPPPAPDAAVVEPGPDAMVAPGPDASAPPPAPDAAVVVPTPDAGTPPSTKDAAPVTPAPDAGTDAALVDAAQTAPDAAPAKLKSGSNGGCTQAPGRPVGPVTGLLALLAGLAVRIRRRR